ncbi:hypothetical protein CIT292_11024 [Citrobacter youngae ATCC 29220]|uniref:Uncharacterized protein n=2 Tax=Citrobacter youngae TaxID=133448 RepID=D4BKE7_9ENTR|nr:hypothetical protein CIT292_11024 [Citrobacter youngae ATCC 29220]
MKSEVAHCIKDKKNISYQDHVEILQTVNKLNNILFQQGSSRLADKSLKINNVLNMLPKLESPGYKAYQTLLTIKDNIISNNKKLATEKSRADATKNEIYDKLDNLASTGNAQAKLFINKDIFELRDQLVRMTRNYGTTSTITTMQQHHEYSKPKPVTHTVTKYTDTEHLWLNLKNKTISACKQQSDVTNHQDHINCLKNKAARIAHTFNLVCTSADPYGLNSLKKL